MKFTGTLTLLCCLMLLLLPAEGQRRGYYRRGRSRGSGRALRRLATAGLLFGAGTAFGIALGRGRRDVTSEDDDLGLEEEAVLEALQAADSQHCMEQWLCDIAARAEEERAEEEQDMVMLFEEEAVETGPLGELDTPRSVYVNAAAIGILAARAGDRSQCLQPECPMQPDQLLEQLRAAEGSDSR